MRPSARMRSVTPNRSARGTSCSGGGMRRLYRSSFRPSRISMTSRWPSVVSSPTLAPLCSSRALVATVVPCTMRSVSPNSRLRGSCRMSARRSRPAITPIEGSSGVDATFTNVGWPVSSTATTSVNVPPTSMPIFSIDVTTPSPTLPRCAGKGAVHSLSRAAGEGWGGGVSCNHNIHDTTNPLVTSRSRAAGSRFAGSPQPPPPPNSILNTSPGRIAMPTSFVFSTRGWRPSECRT